MALLFSFNYLALQCVNGAGLSPNLSRLRHCGHCPFCLSVLPVSLVLFVSQADLTEHILRNFWSYQRGDMIINLTFRIIIYKLQINYK